MKLVKAEQMKAIDAEAIENRGIPGIELMENAGRGIADFISEINDHEVEGLKFFIFCGKGNNGGDGFVVGRYLMEWGATVDIFLFGKVGDLKGDALENCKRADSMGIPIVEVDSENKFPSFGSADMLIDAFFGTGFRGEIRGLIAPCVELMNGSGVPIVSVDAPSGLDTDTGEYAGACINASYTATLALPKIGQFLYPGRERVGLLRVIPIGIPDDIVEQANIRTNLLEPEYIDAMLPHRAPDAHKGSCGKLFMLAGSQGMTGAACLAAESAIRSGVGLCFLGVPAGLNDVFEIKLTEAITRPLPDINKKQCLALRGLGEIREHLSDADALVLGPGLGQHHETRELVHRMLSKLDIPTIIDADGLNCLAGATEHISECGAPLVLTPHPGELSRLMEIELKDVLEDRMAAAIESALRFGCVVLLKGAPTFIADPDGNIRLNPTGNAGMATGGTGDVLSGIIGSLLAQGLDPLDAACCGAYVHGLAGDFAADEVGETAMVPTDMIRNLPEVFLSFDR